MNTRETMIQDYDDVLDARYGKEGTPSASSLKKTHTHITQD